MKIGFDRLLLHSLPLEQIFPGSGTSTSESLGLQVFPAQDRRSGKIGIRPCLKPRGKELAQLREILRVERSNVGGHGYGCGAVFPVFVLWVSIRAAFRVYHTPAKHPPLYGVYLDCSLRQRGCRIVFRQITLPHLPIPMSNC